MVVVIVSEDFVWFEYGEVYVVFRVGLKLDYLDYVVWEFCCIRLGFYGYDIYVY